MGPINIRYHVVSIAAVFLALGVGIIVGSNTNFLGISSIIERQDAVISKLEANYKVIRREVREDKTEIKSMSGYIETLEKDIVPGLLAGRLDGLRTGIVVIGGTPGVDAGEGPFVSQIKAAGARTRFRLRVDPARLGELTAADPGGTLPKIAKELLFGSAFGNSFTSAFIGDGSVTEGDFEEPADVILYIIAGALDDEFVEGALAPLETVMLENGGIIMNAATGESWKCPEIFSARNLPCFQKIETIQGQVEAASYMEKMYKRKLEQGIGGAKSR